eukprot:Hpha_TRINITY_DN11779_c0_g1::TRINITY_DN11779_c0_g1_i1::g.31605::m.31605
MRRLLFAVMLAVGSRGDCGCLGTALLGVSGSWNTMVTRGWDLRGTSCCGYTGESCPRFNYNCGLSCLYCGCPLAGAVVTCGCPSGFDRQCCVAPTSGRVVSACGNTPGGAILTPVFPASGQMQVSAGTPYFGYGSTYGEVHVCQSSTGSCVQVAISIVHSCGATGFTVNFQAGEYFVFQTETGCIVLHDILFKNCNCPPTASPTLSPATSLPSSSPASPAPTHDPTSPPDTSSPSSSPVTSAPSLSPLTSTPSIAPTISTAQPSIDACGCLSPKPLLTGDWTKMKGAGWAMTVHSTDGCCRNFPDRMNCDPKRDCGSYCNSDCGGCGSIGSCTCGGKAALDQCCPSITGPTFSVIADGVGTKIQSPVVNVAAKVRITAAETGFTFTTEWEIRREDSYGILHDLKLLAPQPDCATMTFEYTLQAGDRLLFLSTGTMNELAIVDYAVYDCSCDVPTRSPRDSPTLSPSQGPSHSPSPVPTASPSLSPLTSLPSISPTSSPQKATLPPTVPPTVAPSVSPRAKRPDPPTLSPVVPTANPIGPSSSPIPGPTPSPSAGPTASPAAVPTANPIGPSSSPSLNPIPAPTGGPTAGPTASPAVIPTLSPIAPTANPIGPSSSPSLNPIPAPTGGPTAGPTASPAVIPTLSPVAGPTANPSAGPILPTASPVSPTKDPARGPTNDPTLQPTTSPTQGPIPFGAPSQSPRIPPTRGPTGSPSAAVCATVVVRSDCGNPGTQRDDCHALGCCWMPLRPNPTNEPWCVHAPTDAPTVAPSVSPVSPSRSPSRSPTGSPAVSPTRSPSAGPSTSPIRSPSLGPSNSPISPTRSPSAGPNASPTGTPSLGPTNPPIVSPTRSPSVGPTNSPISPTRSPSAGPIASPTESPSAVPTPGPSALPTGAPTVPPSKTPSSPPSRWPSAGPSVQPSLAPSLPPTATESPTNSPTLRPTRSPTNFPTTQPSISPSPTPSLVPSQPPTTGPTGLPSVPPTLSPEVPMGDVKKATEVAAEASTVSALGSASAAAAAQAGRLQLLLQGCIDSDGVCSKDLSIPFSLHVTQLRVPGFTMPSLAGCVIANCSISVVALLLHLAAARLLSKFNTKASRSDGEGILRYPTGSVMVMVILSAGPMYSSVLMIRCFQNVGDIFVGLVTIICCLAVPAYMFLQGRRSPKHSVYKLDGEHGRRGIGWAIMGKGEWLSFPQEKWGVERWGVGFKASLPGKSWVLALDVFLTLLAGMNNGVGGGTCGSCATRKLIDMGLGLVIIFIICGVRPYARPVKTVVTLLAQGLLASGAAALAHGFLSEECEAGGAETLPGHAAAAMLLIAGGVTMLLSGVIDLVGTLTTMKLDRRGKLRVSLDKFVELDTDGSGALGKHELMVGLERAFGHVSEEAFDALWQKLDSDGNGELSIQEFIDSEHLFWDLEAGFFSDKSMNRDLSEVEEMLFVAGTATGETASDGEQDPGPETTLTPRSPSAPVQLFSRTLQRQNSTRRRLLRKISFGEDTTAKTMVSPLEAGSQSFKEVSPSKSMRQYSGKENSKKKRVVEMPSVAPSSHSSTFNRLSARDASPVNSSAHRTHRRLKRPSVSARELDVAPASPSLPAPDMYSSSFVGIGDESLRRVSSMRSDGSDAPFASTTPLGRTTPPTGRRFRRARPALERILERSGSPPKRVGKKVMTHD